MVTRLLDLSTSISKSPTPYVVLLLIYYTQFYTAAANAERLSHSAAAFGVNPNEVSTRNCPRYLSTICGPLARVVGFITRREADRYQRVT